MTNEARILKLGRRYKGHMVKMHSFFKFSSDLGHPAYIQSASLHKNRFNYDLCCASESYHTIYVRGKIVPFDEISPILR